MPKRLLRGVLDFGDNKISVENLNVNYNRLSKSNFEWHHPDERKLWTFIKGYFQVNHEAPSAALARDYFERTNEMTVIEKILDVQAVEVYVRTHYSTMLEQMVEEQNQNKVRKLLQEVEEIVTKGKIINKEIVKGVKEGLLYFNTKIYEAIPSEGNSISEGDITQDADAQIAEYQSAKINKDKVYGKFTGIDKIDTVCHGQKNGELWIHAAAPGQLKTTFALNWCYNLITRYRANVLYVSLEMKYEHLRKMVAVMHTTNGRFRSQGFKSLDYRKVRDGELETAEEEAFYAAALKDFEKNPEYHRFKVWSPDHDVSIADIRVYAELLQKTMDIGMIVIDHGGLVKSSRPHKDYTVELNAVLRESKKLALHFNGGRGVPVLMLFQINRMGLETVEKKKGTPDEGKYTFSALSYANECLVEGTVVKTNRGYIPIESIREQDKVWSRSGWRTVESISSKKVSSIRRVVATNGAFIETTPGHLLRVFEDDGSLSWRSVEELQKGDILVGDFGSRPFPETTPALPSLEQELKGVVVPTHLTPNLAYLIGVYQARGLFDHNYSIGYLGGLKSSRVRFFIEKAFMNTFDNFLGNVVNPVMRRWLRDVGMDHRIDGVAPIITQAPREHVVEYLRGFFDIMFEGSYSTIPQSGYLKCFQEVQMLLADLGIDSKVSIQSETTSTLRILSHSYSEFREVIKHSDPEMREKAAQVRAQPYGHGWNLPFMPLLSNKSKKKVVRGDVWIRLSKALERDNLITGLCPLQVERIEVIESQAITYDISVDGDDKEFSSAGFLSHNCERSADYVTTSYLNEELKKQGIAKFHNLKNRDNDLFGTVNVRVDFSCRRMWNWEPTDQIDIGYGSGMDQNTVSMFEGML